MRIISRFAVRSSHLSKDACKEAGIKDLVTYVDYSGGQALEHSESKYKLITNQSARKTFITNSIMPGMNTKTIKEITGHKKDVVFIKYVKNLRIVKKLEMARNWVLYNLREPTLIRQNPKKIMSR